MTAIVELLLTLLDLAKAELDQAKRSMIRLVLALLILAGGVMFIMAAFGLFLAAVYIALSYALNAPISALLTGVISLVVAGGLLCTAYIVARR